MYACDPSCPPPGCGSYRWDARWTFAHGEKPNARSRDRQRACSVPTLIIRNVKVSFPDQLIDGGIAINDHRGGPAFSVGIDFEFVDLNFSKLAERLARFWAPRFLINPGSRGAYGNVFRLLQNNRARMNPNAMGAAAIRMTLVRPKRISRTGLRGHDTCSRVRRLTRSATNQ